MSDRRARRRAALPRKLSYPEDLPITEWREILLETIRNHQVVIVAGETGSGKSTQLPKLCLELERGVAGMIGHTQPRRIAARSIAERVAEEIGTTVGGLVGYQVRFSDRAGPDTLIKVMTDGILLNEIHRDRTLRRYDTIIVDEAHERSLNIDFLLGFLRDLLPRRPDLKVIITSATIDTERFAAHFFDAPVVEVSGRTYPVEVRYRPLDDPDLPEPRDQPQGICDAAVELYAEGRGDILVFCSGEREIRDAADALQELDLAHTEILPLYGRLSAAEQHRVFEPHRGRRIVLATNVAETSLTVPGIRYVVDAGTARISRYGRRTKVQRLPIESISQASAAQRAGRCGRLGPGVCVRLYAEDDFNGRPEFTDPEIQRTNLAAVVLQMAALGLGDIESFPFLDPPDSRTIRDGIALLEELGAIKPTGRDRTPALTQLGRRLSRIPADLRLGRMLLAAEHNDCLREVTVIAAALSIQDPRERPADREQHADQMHRRFQDPDSDFLGWLRLWEYLRTERRARTSNQFRKLCREEFLNYRRVREWQDIHAQLRDVTQELGLDRNRKPAPAEAIHHSILAGLLSHIGSKDPDGYDYRGARGSRFFINPGSALFKRSPHWIMAAELVETSRLWARSVAPIDPAWAEKAGAHLTKHSTSDPWWEEERGAALANETVTLYGLPLVTDRTVLYGKVDPEGARELFIRHALVAGEWDGRHRFVEHNRAAIDAVLELEARERRPGLLVSDEALVAFFDQRLPPDVVSVGHFDGWWKRQRRETPHLLDLTEADLIAAGADLPDEDAFPPAWHHGDLVMPLTYEYEPGAPSDGITVDVPVEALDRLDPAVFEWQVPGYRVGLVDALIRSLPKPIRRAFVPIPDTVQEILPDLDPGAGGLVESLRRVLVRRSGVPIPPDAFDRDAIPDHLRMTYRIVDDDEQVLATGRDLAVLKEGLREQARAVVDAAGHELEQTGITRWSIGELPQRVEIEGAEHRAVAYPALVDEGDSVAVRLLATAAEQAEAMWAGTRRLLVLNLPAPRKVLRSILEGDARWLVQTGPYGAAEEWIADCLDCALDQILDGAGGPPWDGAAFDALLERARSDLADVAAAVGRDSLQILEALQEAEAAAGTLPDGDEDLIADVVEQLARFIYPGFLADVGADRLSDIRRYVAAVGYRLRRLPQQRAKDRDLMLRVRLLEEEFDRIVVSYPPSAALGEIGWMLQELRVSFFAQALGTRGKVSEKRIAEALEGVLGG